MPVFTNQTPSYIGDLILDNLYINWYIFFIARLYIVFFYLWWPFFHLELSFMIQGFVEASIPANDRSFLDFLWFVIVSAIANVVVLLFLFHLLYLLGTILSCLVLALHLDYRICQPIQPCIHYVFWLFSQWDLHVVFMHGYYFGVIVSGSTFERLGAHFILKLFSSYKKFSLGRLSFASSDSLYAQ